MLRDGNSMLCFKLVTIKLIFLKQLIWLVKRREARLLFNFLWKLNLILRLGNLHSVILQTFSEFLQRVGDAILVVSPYYLSEIMAAWPHMSSSFFLPELKELSSEVWAVLWSNACYLGIWEEGQWIKGEWREERNLGQDPCSFFSTVFLGSVEEWAVSRGELVYKH